MTRDLSRNSCAMVLGIAVFLLLLVATTSVAAYSPPRMQVRYNSSFLDVPDGYKPYPFRTQVWYRYVSICSDLVINIDLTNMGQGDAAVVVEISNCYICHGASLRIQAWGSGTYSDDTPASFSRPVHINISSNVVDSVLTTGAFHLVGVLPARSTVVVSNNTLVQTSTRSVNDHTQAFLLLEGLWLRDKSQMIVEGNTVTCALPFGNVDPTSACYGLLIKEGLRLFDVSSLTVRDNTFTLGAHNTYGVGMPYSSAGAGVFLTRYSIATFSKNTFDLASIAASSVSNAPQEAIGILVDADVFIVSVVSSVLSLGNTYRLPNAAAINTGWHVTWSGPTVGLCDITITDRSMALFSSENVEMTGGGANGFDGFLAFNPLSTLSIAESSVMMVESSTLTVTAGAAGGFKSLISLGGVVTVGATGALWINGNVADYSAAGVPTTDYTLLNTARRAASSVVAGADGVIVRENTCASCGAFYAGGINEGGALATVDALTVRCNVMNGGATTSSLFAITSLTAHGCLSACLNGVDCFAPNTASAAIVGLDCQCTCTIVSTAYPSYGSHCLPGGMAMTLPQMFSSTMTLTESESSSVTATPTNSTSPSNEWSKSVTSDLSASASVSLSPEASPTSSVSMSQMPSLSRTQTFTLSPSFSTTPSPSESPTTDVSASVSTSFSQTMDASQSQSISTSASEAPTASPSTSTSSSPSGSSTETVSLTPSDTLSPSISPSLSPSASPSQSLTPTFTSELSKTVTYTEQQTLTETITYSMTDSLNDSVTTTLSKNTWSGTSDQTLTATEASFTEQWTMSATSDASYTFTKTQSNSSNITVSFTDRLTFSRATLTISPSRSAEGTTTESVTEQFTPTTTTTVGASRSRTSSGSRTVTTSMTDVETRTLSTSSTKSRSQEVSRSPSRSHSSTVTEEITTSASMSGGTPSRSNKPSSSSSSSVPPTVTPTETRTEGTSETSTLTNSSSPTLTDSNEGPTLTRIATRTPSRGSASRSVAPTYSASPTATSDPSTSRTQSTPSSATRSASRRLETATVLVSPTGTVVRKSITRIASKTPSGSVTSETVTLTAFTSSPAKTKTKELPITETLTETVTHIPTPSATGTETRTDAVTLTESIGSASPSFSTSSNGTVTATLSEMASWTTTVSDSRSGPTVSPDASRSLDVTAGSGTDEQTATMTETLILSVSPSLSHVAASGTVSESPRTRTLLFTATDTKTDSVVASGGGVRGGVKAGASLSLSPTVTLSRGTNAAIGAERLYRTHEDVYDRLSLTVTPGPVSATPSPSASWATKTVVVTSSASSDATLTTTRTITPPPTPTPSMSASRQVVVPGSFLAHFNVFFIANVQFNDCTWAATYIVGPLLCLVVLHGIGTALWHWGCCHTCTRTAAIDDDGAQTGEATVVRSLLALTTYASVLIPCHGACWFVHTLHLCVHAVVVLGLYLSLIHWLRVPSLATNSDGSTLSMTIVVLGITLIGSQATRPLYVWLSYRYTWDPEVMEAAWREAVNEDERFRAYLASSDEEDKDDAAVGTVVAMDAESMRAPSQAEVDAAQGFAPLYDGEDVFDAISSSSGGSHSSLDNDREAAFDITETSLDQIIQFHMDVPKADGAALFQSFRKEQRARDRRSRSIDQAAVEPLDAAEGDIALRRASKKGSMDAAAAAATALVLRRKARRASDAIRRRRGSSHVADDLIVEDEDIDVGGIIAQYQTNQPPTLPDTTAVSRTHAELRALRAAGHSGRVGEAVPTVVDRLMAHHLQGGGALPLEGDDGIMDAEAVTGTIQGIRRRLKHREARRAKSAEEAVVDGLISQHQRGMDLAAIDDEIAQLPEADFLAAEAPSGVEPGGTGPPPHPAAADTIRQRVRDILSKRSAFRAPSRERKTEADLLIDAHLHGEALETLETMEERRNRRAEALHAASAEGGDPTTSKDVSELLSAFASGEGPQHHRPDAQPSEGTQLDAGRLIDGYLANPSKAAGATGGEDSHDVEVAVDAVMAHILAEQQQRRTAQDRSDTEFDMEALIASHINGTAGQTEESSLVDRLMDDQLRGDAEASKRRKASQGEQSVLADDVDDLVSLHMTSQRKQDEVSAQVEDDVDDVLAFFHGSARGGGASVELGHGRNRGKSKRNQKKRGGSTTRSRWTPHPSDGTVPSIAVSGASSSSDDAPPTPPDVLRPVIPKLVGMQAPSEDQHAVSPRATMSTKDEQVAKGLLHASSPFSSRRLALETPRSSPSATPRVQRHTDIYSGVSSDGSGSPTFERHFVSRNVELLPEDDAETPQPQGPAVSDIPKGVDDWIVIRRTGEGYDDAEASGEANGAIDVETLLAEDMRLVPDGPSVTAADPRPAAAPSSAGTEGGRPTTVDSYGLPPGTADSYSLTLVGSFFASSDDDKEETSAQSASAPKTKKRTTRKKKKRTTGAALRSGPRPRSLAPKQPEEDFLSLHTAMTPGPSDVDKSSSGSIGKPPVAAKKNSTLSLQVLASLSAEPPSFSPPDGIEIPSLNSSLLSIVGPPQPTDGSLPTHASANLDVDDDDVETNSSVDHQFEKYCGSTAVPMHDSDDGSDVAYVDLPIVVRNSVTIAVMVALLALCLFALYHALEAIGDAEVCHAISWRVLLVLYVLDACLVDPIAMGIAYAYRYVTSNERNAVWREMHPRDGERRAVLLPPLRQKYRQGSTSTTDGTESYQNDASADVDGFRDMMTMEEVVE